MKASYCYRKYGRCCKCKRNWGSQQLHKKINVTNFDKKLRGTRGLMSTAGFRDFTHVSSASMFVCFFLIQIVGVESNWVHSARRPPNWPYCTCPWWLWGWRIWWNDDLQGKPKYSEKTCPSATLSTTNPIWPDRTRTRAAAVGSQRLTAWAMARPSASMLALQVDR
jgi:hypothetical protein